MKKCSRQIDKYESAFTDIPQFEDRENILTKLANDIVQGKVVLLLGHQLMLDIPKINEDSPEEHKFLAKCEGDINKWMFNNYRQLYESFKSPLNDAITDFDICYYDAGNADVKQVLEHFVHKSGEPYKFLRSKYDFLSLETSDINPLIATLLKTKYIKVVLTTVYDRTLEKLMREIWGEELKVLNFRSTQVQNREIQNLSHIFLESDMPPTLYYLFGNASEEGVSGKPEFVVLEEDKINIIQDWIKTPSRFLKDYVLKTQRIDDGKAKYERRILAVGCKFEDWLFRFFWCGALQQHYNNVVSNNLVTMSIDENNSDDCKLKDFIDRQDIKSIQEATTFLNALNERLRTAEEQYILTSRKRGGVFISYSSRYKDQVRSLYYALKSNGIDQVWLDDEKLTPGDEYEQSIKRGINECTVFLPVLGREMQPDKPAADKYDRNSEGYCFYRDFEWRLAKERAINEQYNTEEKSPMMIIPFGLSDYNPKKVEFDKEVVEEYDCIFGKTVAQYTDRMGFTVIIDKIKRHLENYSK